MRTLLTLVAVALAAGRAADVRAASPVPVLLVTGPEASEGLYRWRDRGREQGLAPYLERRGHRVRVVDGADLGAAITDALGAWEVQRVALVGFGLGGTACYRHLAAGVDAAPPIAALVTVGAPFAPETSPLQSAIADALHDPGTARMSQLAGFDSPVGDGDLFGVGLTTATGEARRALAGRSRVAGALERDPALDDLGAWIDGAASMAAVPFPALTACGDADRFAPCEQAWRARDALGDGARTHRFGWMNHDRARFGHLDLALSGDARRRVFPEIARFLRRAVEAAP